MMTEIHSLKRALFAGCALFALTGTAHAADAAAACARTGRRCTCRDRNDVPAGEIVVTATRRNESIQNVPMTLQAFGGDALGKLNVTTFSDLLKYTPNVTFASNGPGQGQIFMRGLATGSAGNQSSGTIAPFPNVALYLDDQSMQFPARNADVYVADLERVEVLEGPQGTLFGGGAEAGAVRYITNKPKLDKFEGHMEGSFGGTAGGAPNGAFNATVNVPIVKRHPGRSARRSMTIIMAAISTTSIRHLPAARPTAAAVSYGYTPTATNQSNNGQYNNADQVKKNYNPVDYTGGRIEALWDIVPDWNLLVAESYQKVDAEGTFASYPNGSDGQALGNLQTTTFSPSYNRRYLLEHGLDA